MLFVKMEAISHEVTVESRVHILKTTDQMASHLLIRVLVYLMRCGTINAKHAFSRTRVALFLFGCKNHEVSLKTSVPITERPF